MSGHSKWSQIKRQKGIADAKRGQTFTKLANAITIAVRQAGGVDNPESNFKLRLAVEKARQANMPKENIQRAIDWAGGRPGEADLEEVIYEGFGPQNIAVMVEAVTDNRLRTQNALKNFFDKEGGILGNSGSVGYLFEKKGLITVIPGEKTTEEIFLIAVDSEAEDVEEDREVIEIYTRPAELHLIKDKLEKSGVKVVSAELIMKPKSPIEVGHSEQSGKIIAFLEGLEDLDDVQKVYTNADIVTN